ncbi:hypothetical protein GCM10027053_15300 [Intrasporangium mesophilum]
MTTSTASARSAGDRIRQAIADRPSTDYVFHFWTALGWTVLTFGLYGFYVFYQLMKHSRDHNRRRIALLAAARELARERAAEQGTAEDVRPALERVQAHIQSLRAMDDDFREPTFWLLASFVGSGLVWLVEAILLDQDLIQHERHERAAEAELTVLFAELGVTLPAPAAAAKQPHSYLGRIAAAICTFGLYALWWVADLMHERNEHVQQDHAWEDALLAAVGTAPTAGRGALTGGDAQTGRG